MNHLLGLAVLAGPLWLTLILLTVAIFIAVMVAKRFQGRLARIGIGLLVLFVIFFAPFADGIAGKAYLTYSVPKKPGSRCIGRSNCRKAIGMKKESQST